MYPPFIAPTLLLKPAISDPAVGLDRVESLSVFHIFFPPHKAHKPKAESLTRKVVLPRSPWAHDYGPLPPSSQARRQSGNAIRRAEQIGPRHWDRSRQQRASNIRRTTAAVSCGIVESSRDARKPLWFLRMVKVSEGQMFAVSDVSVALELRRTIRSENGRPHRAARMPGIG